MSNILIENIKEYIIISLVLLSSVLIHENSHYNVAKTDGAQIYEYNYFCKFEDGKFVNPYIRVNEFTFSSPIVLIQYYLAGFLVVFIPGMAFAIILYLLKSKYWEYPFMWAISAPLVSLTDFNRLFELLDMVGLSKWVYVGIGVLVTLMLGFMRGTNFDVHGTESL